MKKLIYLSLIILIFSCSKKTDTTNFSCEAFAIFDNEDPAFNNYIFLLPNINKRQLIYKKQISITSDSILIYFPLGSRMNELRNSEKKMELKNVSFCNYGSKRVFICKIFIDYQNYSRMNNKKIKKPCFIESLFPESEDAKINEIKILNIE